MRNLKNLNINSVIEKYYKSEKLRKATRETKATKRAKNYETKKRNFCGW